MFRNKFKIIDDPEHRFKRLKSIPTSSELNDFYKEKYFSLIRKGGRAPEMRKLLDKKNSTNPEFKWLKKTLYKDICQILRKLGSGDNLFDVGCGTGHFLRFAISQGYVASGIEPSQEGFDLAQTLRLNVEQFSLEEYVENHKKDPHHLFDFITLINVLEHLPNPKEIIEKVKTILRPGGIICIRVPNDFSEIQIATQKKLGIDPWWIDPDHVSYFNFKSLKKFLTRCDLEVVYSFSDFPMEFYLLMNDNYVKSEKIGKECHKKRVHFELSIPCNLRRNLYKSFAELEIGRNCLVFAKKHN